MAQFVFLFDAFGINLDWLIYFHFENVIYIDTIGSANLALQCARQRFACLNGGSEFWATCLYAVDTAWIEHVIIIGHTMSVIN